MVPAVRVTADVNVWPLHDTAIVEITVHTSGASCGASIAASSGASIAPSSRAPSPVASLVSNGASTAVARTSKPHPTSRTKAMDLIIDECTA